MTEAGVTMTKPERALWDFVKQHGVGKDIPIDAMFAKLCEGSRNADNLAQRDQRQRQQYVGAFVSRINRCIAPQVIEPGQLKRTYRLAEKTQ